MSLFINIHLVGFELFHADRQSWRSQKSLLANFAKAPKKKGNHVCKLYLQQRYTFHVLVVPVVGLPVLARHLRYSNECVSLFDAVRKSEHAVHVKSEGRTTGDWEAVGLKLLRLHLHTNPIFFYRNWRKPRKSRQFSRWCGEEYKKAHPDESFYCCKNPSGGRRKPGYKTHLDA
jgi:hypothetical protein